MPTPPRRRASRRRLALPFDRVCRLSGVPVPVPEYRFALPHGRQWRFDWAWPALQVALEIDGGAFVYGRHQRPAGFAEDLVKLNTAALDGWLVLRATPQQVARGEALAWVRRAVARRTRSEDL